MFHRGDEEILAVVDGSVAYAMELLGVGIEVAGEVDGQALEDLEAIESEVSDLGSRGRRRGPG